MRRHTAVLCALFLLGRAGFAAAPGGGGESADVRALAGDLQGYLDSYRARDALWGVLVVSLDRGDTLFALNPDSAMAPASNMKLLTTAAALTDLGPDFRFRTYLLADGEVRNGVLDGDLILYGTGDPGISDRFFDSKTEVFHLLLDQMEARGIRMVTGDLVGDASFLGGPLRPEGWDRKDLNDAFAAPVSALSFNENVVSFRVEATTRGRPPRVHTIPDHAGIEVSNQARTVAGRARPRLGIAREAPEDPVLVEGQIRQGARDAWRQMTVDDPPRFTLSVFRATLEERGVRVLGGTRVVSVPALSRVTGRRVHAPARSAERPLRILASHVSPPLLEYLRVVNKKSNNLFAELTFRTLGRVREGVGTPEAGARAVRGFARRVGLDVRGLRQLDGSGLSADNRVRPATLVGLMEAMAASDLWDDYWSTLPTAGRRRELPRMYRTAAAGNLRAKTGTIEDVSALSGVVRSADGERLAFSIVVNHAPSTTRAKRVENLFGARLASFHRSPGFGAPTPPLRRP